MSSLLAVGTDFVQASPDSTGKKLGFKLAGSGLYVPASVLVDDAGNTIDGANAALAGTERGLVTRPLMQSANGTAQTGNITTSTGVLTATGLAAFGSAQLVVSGTYGFTTTPPTYVLEASADSGTTWQQISEMREDTNVFENGGMLAANMLRSWVLDIGGFDQVRLRFTAWGTPSGTIAARLVPVGPLFCPPPAVGVPTGAAAFSLAAANVTGVTSETLFTLTPQRDGTNGSTGTSFSSTTGKRIAITGLQYVWKNGTAAAGGGMVFLRISNTGAVTTSSSLVAATATGPLTAATTGHTSTGPPIAFANPIIVPQGGQVGISHLDLGAVAGGYVVAWGYEF
jgi:hypothetical protein